MLNRLTKFLAVAALLFCVSKPVHAEGDALFSKGHTMWDSTGVNCTTGTAVQITVSTPGWITSGVRLTNQDSTYAVWIGYDSNVSTKTLAGDAKVKRGEKLVAGASGVWELGYDSRSQTRPKLFCIAADGAGTSMVPLSAAIFAYP